MKTRTLLLLALGCGVAIMLAGAVFLVQLATRDELPEPVRLGTPTAVGDVSATVTSSVERAGVLAVSVSLDAPADVDPTRGFHLIASGRAMEPLAIECAEVCTLTFDTSAADGRSRVLFYARGDEQARWVLG